MSDTNNPDLSQKDPARFNEFTTAAFNKMCMKLSLALLVCLVLSFALESAWLAALFSSAKAGAETLNIATTSWESSTWASVKEEFLNPALPWLGVALRYSPFALMAMVMASLIASVVVANWAARLCHTGRTDKQREDEVFLRKLVHSKGGIPELFLIAMVGCTALSAFLQAKAGEFPLLALFALAFYLWFVITPAPSRHLCTPEVVARVYSCMEWTEVHDAYGRTIFDPFARASVLALASEESHHPDTAPVRDSRSSMDFYSCMRLTGWLCLLVFGSALSMKYGAQVAETLIYVVSKPSLMAREQVSWPLVFVAVVFVTRAVLMIKHLGIINQVTTLLSAPMTTQTYRSAHALLANSLRGYRGNRNEVYGMRMHLFSAVARYSFLFVVIAWAMVGAAAYSAGAERITSGWTMLMWTVIPGVLLLYLGVKDDTIYTQALHPEALSYTLRDRERYRSLVEEAAGAKHVGAAPAPKDSSLGADYALEHLQKAVAKFEADYVGKAPAAPPA